MSNKHPDTRQDVFDYIEIFYNPQRPHTALGGKPSALVYWQRNDIDQPDQQAQRVA